MRERPLPQNQEAEEQVLGSLLLFEKINECRYWHDFIQPSYFYHSKHKALFEVITKCLDEEKCPNIVALSDFIDQEMMQLVMKLTGSVVSRSMIKQNLKALKETAVKRKCILEGNRLQDDMFRPDWKTSIDQTINQLMELQADADISEARDTQKKLVRMIEEQEPELQQVSLGFLPFDSMKLYRKQVMTIGARPAVGKTALALSCIRRQIKQGMTIGIGITESPAEELLRRMCCAEAGISYDSVMDKFSGCTQTEIESFCQFAEYLKKNSARIHVFDKQEFGGKVSGLNRCIKETGVSFDCFYVDYLQDLKPPRHLMQSEERIVISYNIDRLGDMAEENDCAVVVLSQLNRSSAGTNTMPSYKRLKGSGKIEEKSHIIMMIHDPNALDKRNKTKEVQERIVYTEKTRITRPFKGCLAFRGKGTEFLGIYSPIEYETQDEIKKNRQYKN